MEESLKFGEIELKIKYFLTNELMDKISKNKFLIFIITAGILIRIIFIITTPIIPDEALIIGEGHSFLNNGISVDRLFFMIGTSINVRGIITACLIIPFLIFPLNYLIIRLFFLIISLFSLYFFYKTLVILEIDANTLKYFIILSMFDPISIIFFSTNVLTEPVFLFFLWSSVFYLQLGFSKNSNAYLFYSLILAFLLVFVRLTGILYFIFCILSIIYHYRKILILQSKKFILIISISIIIFFSLLFAM